MSKRQSVKAIWLVTLMLSCMGLQAANLSARPVGFTRVELNGQPLTTSVAPIEIKGRTLVPMRDIFEALGASVQWNGLTRGIMAQKGTNVVNLQINNNVALINGRNVMLDQAPILYRGSTMVPLRFVSEALGAQVQWNGALRLVSISAPDMTARNTVVYNPTLVRPAPAPGITTTTTTSTTVTAPVVQQPSTVQQPSAVDSRPPAYVDSRPARDRILEDVEDVYPEESEEPLPGRTFRRDTADVRTISVPEGAVVPVTLDTQLSSATARVGERFMATVISRRLGDSEFPGGSKVEGTIIEARPRSGDNPGVLDLDFRNVILPDGRRVPIQGQLIALDNTSVNMTQGRIMATQNRRMSSGDRLKIVGIGAAAGFVLGRVLDTNSTVTTVLGAAGGYLYSRQRDKNRVREAVVPQGARFGVLLNDPVRYQDTTNYFQYRTAYLRTSSLDPNYDPFVFDTRDADTRDTRDADFDAPADTYSDPDADMYAEDRFPEDRFPEDRFSRPGRSVAGVRTISIPQGAVVPVTLDTELSSATARAGERFTATVTSERLGDSEFPAGSKIEGAVIEARPRSGDNPGVLDLDFRNVILPNGRRVPIQAQLTALDNDNVITTRGRIMAKERSGNRSKIIGTAVGAGVGFVLGKVLDKNTTVTTGIGAIGGYILGRRQGNRARMAEATVPAGTRLGVALTNPVSYTDTTGYAEYRMAYLRNDTEALRQLELEPSGSRR